MARADLTSLLGRLPADELTTPAAEKVAASDSIPAAATTQPTSPRPKPSSEPSVEAPYLGFVRKDTRLREDQLETLTAQARRLNRARRNTGIRITENTLIRVAVDLLLSRIEKASGDDEAALLRSLR